MNLFEAFETNADAETEGARICFGSDETKDPVFIVKRAGGRNRRYQQVLSARMKPHKRALDAGTLGQDKIDAIYRGVFVETVLVGWENVKDRAGKEIAFTKENALSLFERLPDLFDEIVSQAAAAETFRTEQLEETAKK